MPEVRAYLDHRGRNWFSLWMDGLAPTVRRRIQQILGRMADGNLGDVRAVGEGVIERRADVGPGYRIYSAWDGPDLIILLAGGDKSAQRDDIPRARERGETTERGKREEATMPLSEDWKIAERRAIKRDPELHAETVKGIRELLATDDDEDRRVAYHLARGLLELEFDTDAELLAQLRESIPA